MTDANEQARDDAEEMRKAVIGADVVDVGRDTEYVPDAPALRASHPNAEEGAE